MDQPENKKEQLILASSSQRRIEIFKTLKLNFITMKADIKEHTDESRPFNIVMNLAQKKAEHVFKLTGGFVVAADTIVWHDNRALGKPKDKDHAREMLKALSAKRHEVYTGICIIKDGKKVVDFCKTKVVFKELSENEINNYINTNEPLDKAGAYNIAGLGALFVEKIEGDFFNVAGFPVSMFYRLILDNFGYNII